VTLFSIAAVATGWWFLLGIMTLQLIVGLRFGRRHCLACVLYFEFVQPRLGEGDIEDARPPRFANIVGAVFLRPRRSPMPWEQPPSGRGWRW